MKTNFDQWLKEKKKGLDTRWYLWKEEIVEVKDFLEQVARSAYEMGRKEERLEMWKLANIGLKEYKKFLDREKAKEQKEGRK